MVNMMVWSCHSWIDAWKKQPASLKCASDPMRLQSVLTLVPRIRHGSDGLYIYQPYALLATTAMTRIPRHD